MTITRGQWITDGHIQGHVTAFVRSSTVECAVIMVGHHPRLIPLARAWPAVKYERPTLIYKDGAPVA